MVVDGSEFSCRAARLTPGGAYLSGVKVIGPSRDIWRKQGLYRDLVGFLKVLVFKRDFFNQGVIGIFWVPAGELLFLQDHLLNTPGPPTSFVSYAIQDYMGHSLSGEIRVLPPRLSIYGTRQKIYFLGR